MRLRLLLLASLVLLGGCELAIKNGLFACGQPSDCPSGYFCWSSDSRCYDSKEPECEPKTCEEVMAEFSALGIPIECGSLPDGCDGSLECGGCPEGTVCGANGQNFVCGCEENTCSSFGSGAECGVVPTRCEGEEEAIYCGNCLGNDRTCEDNKCVCPAGVECDDLCPGGCAANEVCVDGQCCEPTYPCTKNECSPPGGLPDGCGGVTQCPACSTGEECVFSDELVFKCLGDCTCEAQGIECGSASICGSPTLCGTCEDNGLGQGYRCESGRCVCQDQFEYNDSFDDFALVCGGASGMSCMQEAWSIELQATLHNERDVDYYLLQVLDARTPIVAQAYNGIGRRILSMTYLCPDGFAGMVDCTESTDTVDGIEFCVTDKDFLGIQRRCDDSASSEVGTVLVGVESKDFGGDCDPYGLKIFATYGLELELDF